LIEVVVAEGNAERPGVEFVSGVGVNKVERTRRLGVVAILLELPAFDYGAAIREFYALETVFHDDAALGRFALAAGGGSGSEFCRWGLRAGGHAG